MRVIGGSARGRALRVPKHAEVRPTSDRVREAIFDVLEHLDLVAEASVLDLFAGSGALGIEAASRGAAAVVFVEQSPLLCAAITDNLERTGTAEGGRRRVVRAEALRYVEGRAATGEASFDLALIDPPYRYGAWPALLEALSARFVVVEAEREIAFPEPYVPHRSYRYGTTLVSMAKRQFSGTSTRA